MEVIKIKDYNKMADELATASGLVVNPRVISRNHIHYEFKKGNMAVGVLCMDEGVLSFAPLVSDDKAANSQYISFTRLPDFKIVADLMVVLMGKFVES